MGSPLAVSDKVYQWLAHHLCFSPGTTNSSTTKTDHHDITERLLKVALNTINQINLSHTLVYLTRAGFKLTTLVAIRTDCIGSCKSNYHTITTMMSPLISKTRGTAGRRSPALIHKWNNLTVCYAGLIPPHVPIILIEQKHIWNTTFRLIILGQHDGPHLSFQHRHMWI